MRLIDADAFAEEMKQRQDAVKEWMSKGKDRETCARAESAYVMLCEVKLTLDKIPTIDAVEVKHGEWIATRVEVDGSRFTGERCSRCGWWKSMGIYNYCPNCGAKMDGERRDPCS